MKLEYFSLHDRAEVQRFEELLSQYVATRAQFYPNHISLVNAYDKLQQHAHGGRIFSALLDIQLNYMLLHCDSHAAGATWNRNFTPGKLEGGSVLDTPDKFFGKMDIHRFNTSFVLRYRALWDKIMGLLVLFLSPHDYERFIKSKSKKKSFKKIMDGVDEQAGQTFADLEKILTKFDDSFRTSEAHGTGVLRKFSFIMDAQPTNPELELIGYWNIINAFISKLGSLIGGSKSII